MRIVAVIHKLPEGYGYDIIYKPGITDRILGRKPPAWSTWIEYQLPEPCKKIPEYYFKLGYRYHISGHTKHHLKIITEAMGLKNPDDIDGLYQFIKKTYNPHSIIIIGEGKEKEHGAHPQKRR